MKVQTIKKAMKAPARAKKAANPVVVRQSIQVRGNKNLTKKIPNPRGNEIFTSIPTKTVRQRMSKAYSYSAISHRGSHGIRIQGCTYLSDITSMNDLTVTADNMRIAKQYYLNPKLLLGRVSIMSDTFARYRFRSIRIVYVGYKGSAQDGECIVTYIPDPDVDPSILTANQLKFWFDSIEGSYRGPISTVGIQQGVAAFNLEQMARRRDPNNEKFFKIDCDTTTLNDCYQGKILVGLINVTAATLGDLELQFDLEMIDDEVAPYQLATQIASSNGSPIAITLNPTGTDVPVPAVAIGAYSEPVNAPSGIYSLQESQDTGGPGTYAPRSNIVNKLLQAGTEFVASVVRSPSTGNASATLFNSVADVLTGAATRFVLGGPTGAVGLLAKLVPLLFSGRRGGTGVTFMSSEGYKLALLNHAELFPDDELPENPHKLTRAVCAELRKAKQLEKEKQKTKNFDVIETASEREQREYVDSIRLRLANF